MSLWQITRYEPELGREWMLIALLPEYEQNEKKPFDACILVADPGCEADALIRRRQPEREYCRERNMAVLCVPGWIRECPEADRLLKKTLPAWFESTFPVRVRPGGDIRTGRKSE